MGTINTGVGLISGIDTASLIDSLIALESRGKVTLQTQLANLQTQQTALLDVNARLLSLMNAAESFRLNNLFRAAVATSSNEETITASASTGAQPGSFSFIVKQLVSTSQKLSHGFADRATTPLGLSTMSFELGRGGLAVDTQLENLNGGLGVDRGTIVITDRADNTATVDLADVTTLDEVIERINDATGVSVTAAIDGDRLVVTDTSGATAVNLAIADGAGRSTATDLGLAGDGGGTGQITGANINTLGGGTTLQSLNDGTGVLVRDNVTDFTITAADGSVFGIDLGRIDVPIDDSTAIADLNNGAGVTFNDDSDEADILIVDRTGTEHEVDLTGVITVGGLKGRIATATGGAVTLEVANGERFRVVDNTAGTGLLKVQGAGVNGTDTAEDLGILEETGVNAASFEGGLVPNTVSQGRVSTVQDVIDRINAAEDAAMTANGGRIVASIAADGVSLQIEDTTGGGGNLIVRSSIANPTVASDLGIETDALGVAATTIDGRRLVAALGSVLVHNLNGGTGLGLPSIGDPAVLATTTLEGDLLNAAGLGTTGDSADDVRFRNRLGDTYDVDLDGIQTVQDLIDAVEAGTAGTVTVAVEGQSLRFTDTTGGTQNFRIQDRPGSSVAADLGVDINDPVDTVLSVDTQPVYTATSLKVQVIDRLGVVTSIDVAAAESVRDIIDLINQSGADVTASLNRAGNGLAITDTSGGSGTLRVLGEPAIGLGLGGDATGDRLEGTNLQLRYVAEGSLLDDLNEGRGISNGSFRITDGQGQTAEVSIGDDAQTMYDVIAEINSRGLSIIARVNDNGDGLLIEHDPAAGTPFTALKIESTGGATASDLNIAGDASGVSAAIDGSYERTIDVTVSDSLDDVVEKINDAGIAVSAAVIDTGSGGQRYRLSLTSEVTGSAGELFVDTGGVDLGLTTLSRGEDAKVFFGGADPADALLLRSSSNTISGVVPGLTLDLHQASSDAVTVTVARDVESIEASVTDFVDSFNGVIDTIDNYDFYDSETEQRGVLLGSSITSRVRSNLYRTAQQRAEGVGTSLQYLGEVGIRLGSGGKLELDIEKYRAAYADDPLAVENLFAAFESSSDSVTEIAPGVTVQETSESVTSRGFGDLFAALADGLTDSADGTITAFTDGLVARIDLINERIVQFDERLEAKRERLQTQFNAMELAIANLQGQSSALQSIGANVALAQTRFAGFGT